MADAAERSPHASNKPENVLLVREMLTGVAETVDLDGSDLNDIRTAVTEACNNVVLHAYQGDEGPLEVEVYGARGARSKSSCAIAAPGSARASAAPRRPLSESACR